MNGAAGTAAAKAVLPLAAAGACSADPNAKPPAAPNVNAGAAAAKAVLPLAAAGACAADPNAKPPAAPNVNAGAAAAKAALPLAAAGGAAADASEGGSVSGVAGSAAACGLASPDAAGAARRNDLNTAMLLAPSSVSFESPTRARFAARGPSATASRCSLICALTAWLGIRSLEDKGKPVLGDVALLRNHFSISSRSYL